MCVICIYISVCVFVYVHIFRKNSVVLPYEIRMYVHKYFVFDTKMIYKMIYMYLYTK